MRRRNGKRARRGPAAAALLAGLALAAFASARLAAQPTAGPARPRPTPIPSDHGLPAVQYGPAHLPPPWPGPAGKALPYPVLIADRGNNRMLEVTPTKQVIWQFPPPSGAPSGTAFGYDDDTFFTPDGRSVITNEEDESAISVVDYYTQRQTWTYGHFGTAGYYNNHLNYPDDAYRLANGMTIVADIRNCRELFIDPRGHVVAQWGVNQQPWQHYCQTSITNRAQTSLLGYPNGDTPQPNGDILMSIINGNWVVLFAPDGRTIWKAQVPDIPDNGCQYLSDAQLLPDGDVLVADYAGPTQNPAGCPPVPGKVIIFNPHTGHVDWLYDAAQPPAELDHPSLAEMLPNGNIILNDDYNDRVIVIDYRTKRIIWQYGHDGQPGTAPGYLNTPDGLALDVYRNWYGWLHRPRVAAHAPRTG
jgi:outer membrane protein assembly factor BamB